MTALRPVVPGFDAVRAAIGGLPRVPLAVLPTPLDDAPRLTAALAGPRILVKRDDLTGMALGGNKARMMEYVLAAVIAEGADTVVAGAAAQSNYARHLAAACARLGLECHLVLRRARGPRDSEVQGSLLLKLLYGAHITLIDADRETQIELIADRAASLRAQGRRVYVGLLADERLKWLQAAAYVSGFLELHDQAAAAGITVDRVYAPTLEATHAGLLLGITASGSPMRLRAISPNEGSVWPGRSIEEEVCRLGNEVAGNLGLDVTLVPGDVSSTTAYAGEAYGTVTQAGLAAMRLFGRTEALTLDPVYTAKGAAGLIDDIRSGRIAADETVVFWHTGGAPAVFAYADQLGLAVDQDVASAG